MRKYVFLGDSLIYGYGVSPRDNWVYKLKNTLNLNLYNKGINGSTTTDMLIRFEEDVLSLNPTDVFIMGGTNDLLSNRSVQSIINNIELMIKDPSIANRLFMPSTTYDYCEKNLPLLRKEMLSLCLSYNIKYIDFYSITQTANEHPNLYIDGIHFSRKGQDLLLQKAKNYFL